MATNPPPRRLFGCPFCGQAITGSEDKCRRCGATFSDTTRFECPFCGELVSPFVEDCPSCGIDLKAFLAKTLELTEQSDVDRLLEELGNLSTHAEGPKPTEGAVCPFCGTEVTGVEPFCPNCRVAFLAGMFVQCPTCGAKMRGDALDCPVCATHFSKPLEIEREGRVERIDLERLPLPEKEMETYGLREEKEVFYAPPGQRIFKPQYKVSREEEREREVIREELPVQELPLAPPEKASPQAVPIYKRLVQRSSVVPSSSGAPAAPAPEALQGRAARQPGARSPSPTARVVRMRSLKRPLQPSVPARNSPGGASGPSPRASSASTTAQAKLARNATLQRPGPSPASLFTQLFRWPKNPPSPRTGDSLQVLRQRKVRSARPAAPKPAVPAALAPPKGLVGMARPIVVLLCPSCRGVVETESDRCPHCGIVFYDLT